MVPNTTFSTNVPSQAPASSDYVPFQVRRERHVVAGSFAMRFRERVDDVVL